jgi:Fe2+ or Zn2+ uptake regulation protein
MATDVDRIMDLLAEAGGRRTAPRQAIVEALVAAGSHTTADDLAARVQRRFPSVNVSTVYRTLDALEELGIIDHVHLGHGRAVYHLADEDHQHLVCERCETVEELPPGKSKSFAAMLERDFGFTLDRRHFAIVGVCRRCRS